MSFWVLNMLMFLVFLGVAGAIAAVGVVDDMVADIEDEARAEAEKWLPQGGDEEGAVDLLAEAAPDDIVGQAAEADIAALGLAEIGAGHAVAMSDVGPVVEEGAETQPRAPLPERSLDELLTEVYAEEAAVDADLWLGAVAWAEDTDLELGEVPLALEDAAQDQAEPAETLFAAESSGDQAALQSDEQGAGLAPVLREEEEALDHAVPGDTSVEGGETLAVPEETEEAPYVADVRLLDAVEAVTGLSIDDVMGRGAKQSVGA